jgi:pimeloyl-ACP methyl ester carboxylesterase
MGGVVALLATLERPDYRREYRDAASWIFDVSIDLTDRIPSITVPTLLLWADADPISPVRVGQSLASLLPNAHLVVIPGGDHAFARDLADDIAAHVIGHLGS